MPTTTGHTRAILASKVMSAAVYNTAGDRIGDLKDVVLDKTSSQIMFAVVSFGGFLGIGEKYHSIPWTALNYDENVGGYVVGFTREQLEAAPSYDLDEMTRHDGAAGTSTHGVAHALSVLA